VAVLDDLVVHDLVLGADAADLGKVPGGLDLAGYFDPVLKTQKGFALILS
jgi:hypothetical protein